MLVFDEKQNVQVLRQDVSKCILNCPVKQTVRTLMKTWHSGCPKRLIPPDFAELATLLQSAT